MELFFPGSAWRRLSILVLAATSAGCLAAGGTADAASGRLGVVLGTEGPSDFSITQGTAPPVVQVPLTTGTLVEPATIIFDVQSAAGTDAGPLTLVLLNLTQQQLAGIQVRLSSRTQAGAASDLQSNFPATAPFVNPSLVVDDVILSGPRLDLKLSGLSPNAPVVANFAGPSALVLPDTSYQLAVSFQSIVPEPGVAALLGIPLLLCTGRRSRPVEQPVRRA
jgi:hypothetical protein